MSRQMLEAFMETMQIAREALATDVGRERAIHCLTFRICQIELELQKVPDAR